MNKITRIFFCVGIFALAISFTAFCEDITITTYYPSPYGSYNELSANELSVQKREAIGDLSNPADGKTDTNDMAVDAQAIPQPANGTLTVQNAIGIGTRISNNNPRGLYSYANGGVGGVRIGGTSDAYTWSQLIFDDNTFDVNNNWRVAFRHLTAVADQWRDGALDFVNFDASGNQIVPFTILRTGEVYVWPGVRDPGGNPRAGNAQLFIVTDTLNDAALENQNPQLILRQDGGLIEGHLELEGDANAGMGTWANALLLGTGGSAPSPLQLYTNNHVRLSIQEDGGLPNDGSARDGNVIIPESLNVGTTNSGDSYKLAINGYLSVGSPIYGVNTPIGGEDYVGGTVFLETGKDTGGVGGGKFSIDNVYWGVKPYWWLPDISITGADFFRLVYTRRNGTQEIPFSYADFGAANGSWIQMDADTVSVDGDLRVNGSITSGVPKSFRIPHPTKPNMDLIHACVEGPEAGVFYRGEAKLSAGKATISLPNYFEALTRKENRTVLLTAKGKEPFLLSYDDFKNGKFTVYGSKPDGEFSWEVKAVRADVKPLEVEVSTKKR